MSNTTSTSSNNNRFLPGRSGPSSRYTLVLAALVGATTSCSAPVARPPVVPAVEYSNSLKRDHTQYRAGFRSAPTMSGVRAVDGAHGPRLRYVDGTSGVPLAMEAMPSDESQYQDGTGGSIPQRDYNGPLSLGDPGLTASLWRENRADNDLFRDSRAWQPMDLLTIVVSENAEGSKEADTETKSQSSVSAAIENLIGLEDKVTGGNPDVNLDSLISASTKNDFKGEGETSRRGMLKAKISAMVVEILPSGVLRVEGQKIISVNNEEQIMVISGIVRTRDITSDNEIDSSRIANMRIDYYGSGIVGEAQRGGWLGRIVRTVWPF